MKKNHLRIFRVLIITLLITGIFSSGSLISEKKVKLKNINQTKKSIAQAKAIEYETHTTYNSSLPKGTVVTKEEGRSGLAYVDDKDNTLKIIESPVNAEIEIGTKEEEIYIGRLTGYGADCAGCSGNLSCKTKEGSSYNLNSNGDYYNDSQYGSVRILAAALDKFPCGTIIEVSTENLGTFKAIVLDTGGAMRNAWSNGKVHMDLAYLSESDTNINQATSSNASFNVQRWGY